MNRRPLRIWLKRWKALAIVVGLLVQMAVFALLVGLANDWVHGVLSALFQFAVIYGTTRVFRGRGEDIAPERARWRMTAARPAGFVLAACFALAMVQVIYGFIADNYSLALLVSSIAEYGVLATLYARSSFRLGPRVVASATSST